MYAQTHVRFMAAGCPKSPPFTTPPPPPRPSSHSHCTQVHPIEAIACAPPRACEPTDCFPVPQLCSPLRRKLCCVVSGRAVARCIAFEPAPSTRSAQPRCSDQTTQTPAGLATQTLVIQSCQTPAFPDLSSYSVRPVLQSKGLADLPRFGSTTSHESEGCSS